MLNLNSLMIGSEKPRELAEFYEKVLGKKPDMVEGEWRGFNVGSCFFAVGPHDKVKGNAKNPERMIFNFETTEVKKEFERIKALGAKVISAPYSPEEAKGDSSVQIATLADPDGNYFQLMAPWKS